MTRVRLFAALRELAGTGELDLQASSVADVLSQLSSRLGPRFDQLMAAGSVMLDGERVGSDRTLGPDAEVALLPPVSGGGKRFREYQPAGDVPACIATEQEGT